MSPETVKERILILLKEEKQLRYSDFVKKLEKPDKTIYVSLKELLKNNLVRKNERGVYELTEEGRKLAEELEVYSLLREVLQKINAREIKANLSLLMRVKRFEREKSLLILYKVIVLANYMILGRDLGLYTVSLGHLLDIIENHLTEIMPKILDKLPNEKKYRKYIDMYPNVPRFNIPILRKISTEWISLFYKELEKMKEMLMEVKLDSLTPSERNIATKVSEIIDELYERFKKATIEKIKKNK